MAAPGLSIVRLFSNKKAWPKIFTQSKTCAPFKFHGGLCLAINKRALSNSDAVELIELPLPKQLIVPLVNYHKTELAPHVQIRQQVHRGQSLASGVVAPADGTVVAIEPRAIIHPASLSAMCVVIECNAEFQHSKQGQALSHETAQTAIARFIENPEALFQHSALDGLGGAGFPMADKLESACAVPSGGVHTLIINAAECEPEIACDEALMQGDAIDIVYGIDALAQLSKCKLCILAIEDSKPRALEQLRAALERIHSNVSLTIIPTRYPTGAESPLIEVVTGKRIAHGTKPSEQGIVCVNVGTAHALWQAVFHGRALDSRIISLGGANMARPCNVRVRFGTPVSHVLNATNNAPQTTGTRIRSGGPLSGFDLTSLEVPVTAKTNCILAEPAMEDSPAQACIRCGQCADVCPSRLLPQQLFWYAQSDNLEKCEHLKLDACIECGCCDLVCPSSIKLTETFRYAKATARFHVNEQLKAAEAEKRFNDRDQRLQQRELSRQNAIAKRKEAIKARGTPDTDRINAALDRARSKRKPGKD